MVDASTVSSLLLKLGDAALKEAVILYGVSDRVQSIEREMERIQSFLKDADSKSSGDNRVQNWVKNVRDVSFLIEDVIDTFLIEVGRNKEFFRSLGKVFKKPHVLHKLNSKMNNIENILKEIEQSRTRYGIENLPERRYSTVPLVRRPINPETDSIDLIGVDAEKTSIIELLLEKHTFRRSVVSIVGVGGLGKTTLAEKVYQSGAVKKHFEVSVWLNISRDFNTNDLLKKMTKNLIKEEVQDQEEEHLISKIKEVLKGKRYLVVLDDIWTSDLWNKMMMHVLPDVNNGSRVLITTREVHIAKAADPRSHPWELRLLYKEESLNLFFKKACVDKLADGRYPDDLLEPAKTFLKKCNGLPLALVVVGGLLSTKPQTGVAWNKEIATLKWRTGENECMDILATSFEYLPSNLKPCFIYVASFPEDRVYNAELIIRLWVAEGFIPLDEQCIMEEVAEKYLEELAQRCMIQNIERSITDGSITHFRVHDLLLELAIQEANQKKFLKVFSKQAHFASTSDARRATFQLMDSSWDNYSFEKNKLIKYTKPNVQTLLFFGNIIPLDSQFKLLKALIIENCEFSRKQQSALRNSLKGLLHLICLVLRYCYSEGSCIYLSTDNLHNLQTLDLTGSYNIRGHESLLSIKALRHLTGSYIKIGRARGDRPNLQSLIGRELAPTHLPDLQTLDFLVIHNLSGIELFDMPSLRRLSFHNVSSWESILILVGKLSCLISLRIFDMICPIPLGIIDTRSFSSYGLLQTLDLNGLWQLEGVILSVEMFPPHLTELILEESRIDQDLMPTLEKLQFLKILIFDGTYTGKQMICSTSGFPQLQKLTLRWFDELEDWKIEEGAMPRLNHLIITYCKKLKMLPDLQYVSTLKVLELIAMPKELDQRLQNEDQHKIKHIPSIIIKEHPTT